MIIETPDRILVEAEKQFAEHGFAGTRLANIASAAGLGNAGLLHHFPSKAALYRAVLDSIAADIEVRNEPITLSEDPVTRLEHLVDGLLSLNRDRPTALAIIAHEFLDRSGRIEEAETLPLAGSVRETMRALEDGQRTGSVRQGDPVAMTAALHGALIVGVVGRTVYTRTSGTQPSDRWDGELSRSALDGVLSD